MLTNQHFFSQIDTNPPATTEINENEVEASVVEECTELGNKLHYCCAQKSNLIFKLQMKQQIRPQLGLIGKEKTAA